MRFRRVDYAVKEYASRRNCTTDSLKSGESMFKGHTVKLTARGVNFTLMVSTWLVAAVAIHVMAVTNSAQTCQYQ